ncbi:MAG: hypothetical protein ACETVN_05040, partial [Asgard group archaeon]
MGLEFDILNLLGGGELRPSEIRENLLAKYEKKYDSKRSFDVVISRELSKLRSLINRVDKGHQRVYYSLNEHGVKELERMKLKNHFNNWIDEMNLVEIRDWLSRFKEYGLRLRFSDNVIVRDKDGKIKGKGIGIVWYMKKEKMHAHAEKREVPKKEEPE